MILSNGSNLENVSLGQTFDLYKLLLVVDLFRHGIIHILFIRRKLGHELLLLVNLGKHDLILLTLIHCSVAILLALEYVAPDTLLFAFDLGIRAGDWQVWEALIPNLIIFILN